MNTTGSKRKCECGCGELVAKRFAKGHWAKTKAGRARISLAQKGRPRSENERAKRTGENHYDWQGDDIGYGPLHNWIRKRMPLTGVCQKCGKRGRTERHNISGEYIRSRGLADWAELCITCHHEECQR